MKIISIYNNKGGVGKTTTTKMLANYLAKQNKNILLIDMDPQGNLSSQFETKEKAKYSINDILTNSISINNATLIFNDQISIVKSDLKLLNANNQMMLEAAQYNPSTRLKNKIANLDNHYDYILIDCPPTMDLLVSNALAITEDVIIPVKADSYSIDGIKMLIEKVNHIKSEINNDLKIGGIFMNGFRHSRIHNEIYTNLCENLQLMMDVKIGDYVVINEDTFKERKNVKKLEEHKVTKQFEKLFTELGVL